jgi:inorganic pyrophosphatase
MKSSLLDKIYHTKPLAEYTEKQGKKDRITRKNILLFLRQYAHGGIPYPWNTGILPQ